MMRGGNRSVPQRLQGQEPQMTGLPLTLTTGHPTFTGINTTGGSRFERWARFQNVSGSVWGFAKGTMYFLDQFSVVPARIVTGLFRVIVRDADDAKSAVLFTQPNVVMSNYADADTRPHYPVSWFVKPGEIMDVEHNSATALILAQSELTLNGTSLTQNIV